MTRKYSLPIALIDTKIAIVLYLGNFIWGALGLSLGRKAPFLLEELHLPPPPPQKKIF